MKLNFFRFLLSSVFILASADSLMAGKAARRYAEQMRRSCVMKNQAFNGRECFDCPSGQELEPNTATCRQSAVKCAAGQRVSNGQCVSACPAGQIWQAGKCVLEKCPDGYVKKGNECLKDSGPAASGNSSGSQCGQVNVGGRWQNVKCPAGQRCENPSGRTGTCVANKPAAAVGQKRVENNPDGYCGQVKNPNGATDTVTCGGGMSCEPLAHVSDTDASDSICKKAAPAGGTEGTGQRCGTWYSGGDVTKYCAAGLSCRSNGQEIQVSPQNYKSGTCNRPCTDQDGYNGCYGGWSAKP